MDPFPLLCYNMVQNLADSGPLLSPHNWLNDLFQTQVSLIYTQLELL